MSTLHFIGLTCHKTQEAIDEPYLRVNDRKVWGPKKMNDGEARDLGGVSVPFSHSAYIELWEDDRIGRDDLFGNTTASKSMEGLGEQRVTFTAHRGNYTLSYEVLPDHAPA